MGEIDHEYKGDGDGDSQDEDVVEIDNTSAQQDFKLTEVLMDRHWTFEVSPYLQVLYSCDVNLNVIQNGLSARLSS